jgi:DNA-binding MarR family transcriptional regulator
MGSNTKTIQNIREQVTRFVNLFNKIESIPFDVGNGDLLYPSEMHTIEALGNNKGKTVTELCALFGVTKGAVSQTIAKLDIKGYVKKSRNADYPKEIDISLTPSGKAVFEKHKRFHESMDKELEEFLSAYPSEKISELQQIFVLMSAYVEKFIDMKNKRL